MLRLIWLCFECIKLDMRLLDEPNAAYRMEASMKAVIFFDLDGTLTDSQDGILHSMHYALNEYGLDRSDEELKTHIGPPLIESFRAFGFPPEKLAEATATYRAYFAAHGMFENRVYGGIETLLMRLKSSGKRLAVATSKPEKYAVQILEHFHLAQYFERICGCRMDESRSDKAEVIEYAMMSCALEPSDCARIVMIGDRYADIIGAHKNNIAAAAVLYGYGSRKEFEAHGADYIVESVPRLQELLDTL